MSFGGLWQKLLAIAVIIIGILFSILKIQSARLEKAKNELKVRDKQDSMAEDQNEAVDESRETERKNIEKRLNTTDDINLNRL